MNSDYSWVILSKQANEVTPNQQKRTGGKGGTYVQTTHKDAVLETTKHGYLFRDAISAFRDALKRNDVKKCHFWLAELCISGEVKKSWNIIFDMCIQHIPFVCPNEMVRLYRRVSRMKEKAERKEKSDMNVLHILHDTVNILLWIKSQKACMTSKEVTCLSKAKVAEDPRRFRKAPLNTIHSIVLGTLSVQRDPPSIIAGSHEIVHAVMRNDIKMVRFWLSWLFLWTGNDIKGISRPHRIKEEKYQKDWVWGLWDIVFSLSQHLRLRKESQAFIRYCHSLFSIQYTSASKKKKFPLLLLSFYLCTSRADTWKPITLPILPERIQFSIGMKSFYSAIMQSRQPPRALPLQQS